MTVKLPEEKENPKEIKTEAEDRETPNDINSPEIDENGKPTKKAIEDAKQARAIAVKLFDRAKDGRISVAAVVASKYGGESPFKSADLLATGQGWRNNFTTHFLASIVDRAKPQLVDPIKEATYLTYSSLPPGRENADDKTMKFRARITKLIRKWNGWVNFIDIIAQENYLNGNAAPGHIDDDWRPKAWRFDEVFLPDGVGQHASGTPLIVFRQPILLHELIDKISDQEAARGAGWNIEGCREAINEAIGLRQEADRTPMEEVDQWREQGGLKGTYDGDEVKVVWMFHVLVREYEGGVALWTVAQKGEHELRHIENFEETMSDVTTLFTLQTGNEKFYGSKGAGRMLANVHIAVERGRNLGADQLHIAGLPILECNESDLNNVQPVVRHPFILVGKGQTVAKEKVEFDVQAFQYMDDKLVSIAESIAGAFIPPNVDKGGTQTTRIADAQKAARELAVRNGVLGRFFQQFGELISSMQKKICKPENLKEAIRLYEEETEKQKTGIRVLAEKVYKWLKEVLGGKKKDGPKNDLFSQDRIEERKVSKIADAEAVECLVDLLHDGLTPQDIIELALCPAGNDVQDENPEEEGKTLGYIQAKKETGDPFVNQEELTKMEAELVLGEEGAKRVLMPREDPNIEAIATRQQIIEWGEMVAGEDMPVAITDNHAIHEKVILNRMAPLFVALAQAPTEAFLKTAKMALNHYVEHLKMDTTKTPEDKENAKEQIDNLVGVIKAAEKNLDDLAAQAAAVGAAGPDALPPQVNGKPMQATGPGGTIQGEGPNGPYDIEKDKLMSETILRAGDQKLEHRKLDLKEKELEMKDQHQTLTAVTKTGLDVAREVDKSRREGVKDAEADLALEAGVTSESPKP